MTFKRRLLNTITLTILIFLVFLLSLPLLNFLTAYFIVSNALTLLLPTMLLFLPFALFALQSTFHYLLKKNYPVQDRMIKYRLIRILSWLFLFVPFFVYFLLAFIPYGVLLAMKISFYYSFIMPLYWLWIIKELKDNYGTQMGLGSFFLIFIISFSFNYHLIHCPSDKPIRGYDGCYACNEVENIRMPRSGGNCVELCSNRYFSDNGEYLCILKTCPADKPLQSELDNMCFSCDDLDNLKVKNCLSCSNRHIGILGCSPCPPDKPLQYEGKCYSCDDPTPIKGMEGTICINECPNRSTQRTINGEFACVPKNWKCPADKPLKGDLYYNECYSCDELRSLSVENCNACSDRYSKHIETGGDLHLCVLKKCPQGTILSSERGDCIPCDSKQEVVYGTSEEDCLQCKNRVYDKMNKECYIKNWECPDDKPLKGRTYKWCFSCNSMDGLALNATNCDICPNRYERKNEFGDVFCVLKNCPDDKPFKNEEGECVSCDYQNNIPGLSKEECSTCKDRIYTEDGDCTTCEELSYATFTDEDISQKECEECLPSFYENYGISQEECKKCKRKWDGDTCRFVSIYEEN